jgi:hypothetical protein
MDISRRQFNTLVAVFAAGLVAPGQAQAVAVIPADGPAQPKKGVMR